MKAKGGPEYGDAPFGAGHTKSGEMAVRVVFRNSQESYAAVQNCVLPVRVHAETYGSALVRALP